MPRISKKEQFKRLVKSLTPSQKRIINGVYKMHMVTMAQLQEVFEHKSHSRMSAWLSDLVEKGFLEADTFLEAPGKKKPNIYFLGEQGARAMMEYFGEESDYLKYKLRNPGIDTRMVKHDLLTVDFFLIFLRFARERGDKLEHLGTNEGITQETEGSQYDEFEVQANILSEPDAVLRYFKKGVDTPAIFYLEIDRHNMSGPKFLLKIDRYLRFYDSRRWQERYDEFPMILIVTLSEQFLETILIGLEERIAQLEAIDDMFRLTTLEAVQTKGINARIWQAPFREKLFKIVD